MFESTTDILKQIALGEDSVLELKALVFGGHKVTDPHRHSMADELAAMANTHTGVVLLGVEDKTKTILGIPYDKLDTVETWLRGICNDLIEPPLDCVIRKTRILPAPWMSRCETPVNLEENRDRSIIIQ